MHHNLSSPFPNQRPQGVSPVNWRDTPKHLHPPSDEHPTAADEDTPPLTAAVVSRNTGDSPLSPLEQRPTTICWVAESNGGGDDSGPKFNRRRLYEKPCQPPPAVYGPCRKPTSHRRLDGGPVLTPETFGGTTEIV
ncbi:hypothetical protein HanXRQr2_Chr09g0363141 [Helianthus annuus]|nr:hypothetical protein HanXRQr2_Chr09g0363141 [Helianthus annuus]